MYKNSQVLTKNPGSTTQALGDVQIVVNLSSNKMYELNPSAAEIWSLIDGISSIKRIEDCLSERHPDAEGIHEDLRNTLENFGNYGLVKDA